MKNCLSFFFLIFISSNLISQDWRDSLNVARSAYKNKSYNKAFKYYQSAQKKAPKGIDFLDEMAQSAYRAGAFDNAEKIYNQSSSKSGNRLKKSKTFHNIGNTRLQQKNYKGAIESYKNALRNNPYDEQTRYNLSEAIRRLKAQQEKNEDKQDKKNKNNSDQKIPQKQPSKDNDDKSKNDQQPKSKRDIKEENSSAIPNKIVDKMLDKLMKEESETKRKVSGNKGDKSKTISGKDW